MSPGRLWQGFLVEGFMKHPVWLTAENTHRICITLYNTSRCKRIAEAYHERRTVICLGLFFEKNGEILAFLADVW